MNEVGEKLDLSKEPVRHIDIKGLHEMIVNSGYIRMSWGFHRAEAVQIGKHYKAYRLVVNGHHHKGHVYIVVNPSDYMKVFYTSNRGTIKKISDDVFIGDLIERLDTDIEKIEDYVR